MLCIASAGALTALAISSFTLAWTHSVEQTQWRESWAVTDDGLVLTEASVEGPGAGIAVPPDAVWANGRWTYVPALPPQPRINLAASGMTPSPWTLCTPDGVCRTLGTRAGEDAWIWSAATCE